MPGGTPFTEASRLLFYGKSPGNAAFSVHLTILPELRKLCYNKALLH